MKKVQRLLSMTDGDERKHVLEYTHVDLHYVEDQRKNLLSKFNSLKQELSSCGRGKIKEIISSEEIMFTKEEKYPTKTIPKVTSNIESECDSQEPLPPVPKLSGAEPIGTSNDVTKKESSVKAIKKKAQTKSHSFPDPSHDKKADLSTKQLLITMMEEVKGLKEQNKPSTDNSASVS
ncbi:hypothetical protein Tco_1521861 [Tanacetum coccineum]